MEQSAEEKHLAERLIGKKNVKDLKYLAAPLPLILFCLNGNENFVGDDLGMFAKACSDFFPMPTDKGICFTKNTDIKEVISTKTEYDDYLSLHLQNSDEYNMEGTSENRQSFAFFVGGQKTADMYHNMKSIMFGNVTGDYIHYDCLRK